MSDQEPRKLTKWEISSHIANLVVGVGVIGSIIFGWKTIQYAERGLAGEALDRELHQREFAQQMAKESKDKEEQQKFQLLPLVRFPHDFIRTKVATLDDGQIDIAGKPNMENSDPPQLRNFGNGPAMDVRVTWKPKQIFPPTLAADHPEIMKEWEYPVIPTRISPNQVATLAALPRPYNSEWGKEITAVTGDVVISYRSFSGDEYFYNHTFEAALDKDTERINFHIQPQPNLPPMKISVFQ
jgi:hypothetical protein